MALRKGHGTGAGVPRIEVLPADEQQPGVAAPAPAETGPIPRRRGGQFTPEGARLAGGKGGRAAAERRALTARFASALRIAPDLAVYETHALAAPFVGEAERWLAAKVAELAANVGGGEVGAGVVSILRTAAFQTYSSRMLFELALGRMLLDRDGDKVHVRTSLLAQAARLGDAARQNLLAAHELARLEAVERAQRDATYDAPPGFTVIDEGDDA